jgi:hypothetical protein
MRLFHISRTTLILTALSCATVALAATPSTDWKEKIAPDEAQQFEAFAKEIQSIQHTLAGSGHDAARGFHAKPHAAVEGELTVLPDLAPELRAGLFKESKTYKCWVRFSNGVGFSQSDNRPDVRGLAVKVLGVPGPKLGPGDENASTQDFLTTNGPVSLARNAKQFMAFARAALHPLTFPFTLARDIGAAESARITAFLATTLARPIRSMARETFWSGAPIKFGPYAVKFQFRPVGPAAAHGILPGRDGLRADLVKRFAAGDVRYDMYVQFYVDEKRTPIEDSSVEWKEKVTPGIKVATLVMHKTDLLSAAAQKDEEYVNSLAFSPWHCTEDLRPLGHTMRARRLVYRSSAQLRHFSPEPTGDSTAH